MMSLATAMLAAVGLLGGGTPTLPPPTDAQLASSVTVFRLEGSVRSLATTKQTQTGSTLTLGADVLFDFGSDRIAEPAAAALRSRLNEIPQGVQISVIGYTDSVGSPESNLALSRRRASAVAAVVHGVRPDLTMTTDGKGEADPVQPNEIGGKDNPSGRAQNRRVELNWGR